MTELGFRRADIKGTFHEVLDYTVVEWADGHVLVEMEVVQNIVIWEGASMAAYYHL